MNNMKNVCRVITDKEKYFHLMEIKELVEIHTDKGNNFFLCWDSCICALDKDIHIWFVWYVAFTNLGKETFYNMSNQLRIPFVGRGLLVWQKDDYSSRLKWLDKHILIFKNKINDNDRD